MKTRVDQMKGAVYGVTIGDALGVPYEFLSRVDMAEKPATDMIGFGTHNQLAGTWSDDSSLTFCLMDSLCNGYDVNDMASKFSDWFHENLWTAYGYVFDIGYTTKNAIHQFNRGMKAELCGGMFEDSNGNGSLMRILPLAFYLKNEADLSTRYQKIKDVSSITHAHFRSVFSCFIYVEYVLVLLQRKDKYEAYQAIQQPILDFAAQNDFNITEIGLFSRILKGDISKENEDQIDSTGYVLHSLEASLWCLLNSNSYSEAVLKAVNLGEDTDTTAAITGGLAGLYYGYADIPETWKSQLARFEDIGDLIERFDKSLQ